MRVEAQGQIYEFPDDMPRDQIKAALDRRIKPRNTIPLDITPEGLRPQAPIPQAPQQSVNPMTGALPPLAPQPQLKPMLRGEETPVPQEMKEVGGRLLGGFADRAPHKAKEIGAGLLQAYNENLLRSAEMRRNREAFEEANPNKAPLTSKIIEAFKKSTIPHAQRKAEAQEIAELEDALFDTEEWKNHPAALKPAQWGKLARDNMAVIRERATQGDPRAAFIYDVLTVAGDMVPALAAGVASKNPNVTLGIMGFQAGGGSFGSRREAGENPAEALVGSLYTGAVETLTEKIPVSRLFAKGTPFIKRLLEATVGEGLQEGASSLLQSLYDKGTIRPDMTWTEALAEAGYETAVGAAVGPIIATPMHGVNVLQDKLAQRKQNLFVDQATGETTLPNPEEMALKNLAPRQTPLPPRQPGIDLSQAQNQFAQPLQAQADTITSQKAEVAVPQKKDQAPVAPHTETPQELAPETTEKVSAPRGTTKLDTTKDDIMVAMSKLGGLDRAEAEAQGIDPANFIKQGGRPVFRKEGGRSFDDMAETLRGYGYTVNNPNELLDKIDASLSGERVVSQEYDYAEDLAALERERYGDEINEPKKPYHQPDLFINVQPSAKVSPKREAPTGPNLEIGVPENMPIPNEGVFSRQVKHVTTGHLNIGIDRVQRPEDMAHIIAPIRKQAQENMVAVVTNAQDRIVGVIRHGLGNTDSAEVESGILLGAIHQLDGAKKVWFAHNHPGGDPSQSDADAVITRKLFDNLRGTGIESKGMVVVAPGGKASYLTGRGSLLDKSEPINVRPARRVSKQPVTERVFRTHKKIQPDAVTGPRDMSIAINNATRGKTEEGILLLDNRHNVVGWVPMKASEMVQLRKGEQGVGASKLYRAIDRTNAKAAAINIFNEKNKGHADNVAAFMNANNVRVLDVMINDKSMQNQGRGPGSSTTFYANPFQPIIEAYQRQAEKVLKWAHKKIGYAFSPLGKLAQQNEYLKARNLAQGNVVRADHVAKKLNDAFSSLSEEDAKTVYNYLTTKGATPNGIKNPVTKRKAVAAKRLIDVIGRQLVKRGLLSQAAYDKHKDGYLPRVYLKHLLGEEGAAQIGTGKKPSQMGYLKRRKDIPEEVRQVILGEIQDPGFLAAKATAQPLRDFALLDLLQTVSTNPQWANQDIMVTHGGRKVSAYYLKAEAERLRNQSQYYTEENQRKALKLAQAMENKAKTAIDSLEDIADFKQVPDTSRYGALRGMLVHKEIYEDLIGAGQMQDADVNPIESIFGYGGIGTKITQLWKMSKVALNPPTQVRNFVSNGILLHLSGVPFVRTPDHVIRAINQIAKNGKYWRIAKKHGITSSTFASNELIRINKELTALKAKQKGPISMAQITHLFGKVANTAGDIYQFSEGIFKTAKIIHAMESDGMSEADAVIEANKWMYDYSLVPRTVRYARNAPVGVPFITFYYKTLPRMIEVGVKHPARFLPYAILPALLAEWIADAYDVDDDDVDKLKKTMPGWMNDKATAYVLPYKDQHNRWQAINLEYFLPWSMFSEFTKEVGKGDLGGAVKTTGLLGGPIPDLITAVKTNKDAFTGKEIAKKEDPPAQQVSSIMTYLWGMAMPPWITDKGFAGHLKRSVTGEVKPRSGDLPLTTGQAVMRLFGLNIYPFEPVEQRRRNISYMQYQLKEIARRKQNLLRNKNLTADDRKDIEKVYQAEIKEQRELIKQYKADSQVHENLRGKKSETK